MNLPQIPLTYIVLVLITPHLADDNEEKAGMNFHFLCLGPSWAYRPTFLSYPTLYSIISLAHCSIFHSYDCFLILFCLVSHL